MFGTEYIPWMFTELKNFNLDDPIPSKACSNVPGRTTGELFEKCI